MELLTSSPLDFSENRLSARAENEYRESLSADRIASMQRHIDTYSIRMNVTSSAPERLMQLDNTAVTSMYYGGRNSEIGVASSNSLARKEVTTWFFSEYFRNIVRTIYSNYRYTMKSVVFNSAAKFTMKKIVDEDITRDRARPAGTGVSYNGRNSYQRKKSVSGCRPSRHEDTSVLHNTRFSYSKLANLNITSKVETRDIRFPYRIFVNTFAGNMIYKIHDVREGIAFKKGQTLARGYSDVQTDVEKARLLLFDEVYSMTVNEDHTFVKLQLTFDKKFLDSYFVEKAIVYAGWMFKNIANSFKYTEEYTAYSARPLAVQLEILYNPARYHYSPPNTRQRLDERIQEELFENNKDSYKNLSKNSAVDFDDLHLMSATSTSTPFSRNQTTSTTSTYRVNSRREEMMLNNKNDEAANMRVKPIYQSSIIFKIFDVIGSDIEDFYEKKMNIIYQFANTKRVKACRAAFEESDEIIRHLVSTVKYLK